jgi:NAD(P)-dependent dehydrogenase (short-subunit alcohol dehydrogenase family)
MKNALVTGGSGEIGRAICECLAADGMHVIVPMKRVGTPDEVSALVGFLSSENARYISGQMISINGGMI